METITKPNLSRFKFTQGDENLVVLPSFPSGKFGEDLYELYKSVRQDEFDDNPHLRLQYKNGVITGSNVFDAVLINRLLPSGVSVASFEDLGDEQVLKMIRGKHYTDAPTIVLRSTTGYEPNQNLAKSLAEHIDMSEASKRPAVITGLNIKSSKDKSYGLGFVPSDDFKVYYDERLSGKYNGWNFNEVDELGLPKGLDENKGNRVWYTRSDGLSGLCLGRNLGLNSSYENLASSDSGGRVVVVSAEGTSRKINNQ